MRELKFRAWDVKNKKMSDPFVMSDIKSEVGSDGDLYSPIIEAGFTINVSYLDDSKYYIVLQFTGLLDRNGKEIYEGDILSVDWNDKRYPKHNIGPIYFNEENAQFILGEGGSPKTDAENYMQVVGNVYENPELISN